MSGFVPTKGEKTHYLLLHEAIAALEDAYEAIAHGTREDQTQDKIKDFLTQPQIKEIRGTV